MEKENLQMRLYQQIALLLAILDAQEGKYATMAGALATVRFQQEGLECYYFRPG
ncbi:hypothetical protein [Pontibacter ummariensis]|nr:hypothetical protein [Pontibacter ummariensis]